LQHAGRKASTLVPWIGYKGAFGSNGWPDGVYGPSDLSFGPEYPAPKAMSLSQIKEVIRAFADSARRAVNAGFDVIELQVAHGKSISYFIKRAHL
jgi:2,4-dienoyl-CoA reductase-like NADH-dependent reductase (Old Yellow Enzyme family)